MAEKVPRGDYDMSRSAYLFRHANLVYDMRIQGTSIAKIAEHVGKLEDRPVSRNIIYAFLKKIEDKKERERMIEICDHFGEVKTDLDVVVEKAKKVVCWSPKGLRISDAAGDQKPVFADAGLIKNTAGEKEVKNTTVTAKSNPAIKPSNPNAHIFEMLAKESPAVTLDKLLESVQKKEGEPGPASMKTRIKGVLNDPEIETVFRRAYEKSKTEKVSDEEIYEQVMMTKMSSLDKQQIRNNYVTKEIAFAAYEVTAERLAKR